MLKIWKKRAFLLILLTLLISLISFNGVLAQEVTPTNTNNFSSPNIENINTNVNPTTEDNNQVTSTDENQLTRNERASQTTPPGPKDPYTKYFDAIKQFNEELYGENG
ncbi:MAG: hypothetical protein AB4372_18200 [Xenococcus sp. (in: cyanobacteria)]